MIGRQLGAAAGGSVLAIGVRARSSAAPGVRAKNVQRRLPLGRRPPPIALDDLRHFAGAEHRVDLRNLLLQLVAIALGQAAGDDQPPARAVLLVLRHLEDGVDRLLLRRVDERAGVDDEHVGVRRRRA